MSGYEMCGEEARPLSGMWSQFVLLFCVCLSIYFVFICSVFSMLKLVCRLNSSNEEMGLEGLKTSAEELILDCVGIGMASPCRRATQLLGKRVGFGFQRRGGLCFERLCGNH